MRRIGDFGKGKSQPIGNLMIGTTNSGQKAALSILAGMMVLGITDNLLAIVTETSSLWQFHLFRGGFVLVMLLAAAALGWGGLRPKRVGAVLARSAFQAGAMLIYFGCLALLPIGVVVAGMFTAPLFVLLISVIFQRQRVGIWRCLAVLIGFAGALLVIRPDPAALDPIGFLPVIAGLLYAIGAVATRAWCEGEGTMTLTFWFFVILTAFGAIGVLVLPSTAAGAEGFPQRGWMPLTWSMIGWFVVQAIGAVIGILCLFRGYQLGEANRVAVFEYSLLVFASFWAWVLWGQTVPSLALLGMAMIVVAGVIIALRSDGSEVGDAAPLP